MSEILPNSDNRAVGLLDVGPAIYPAGSTVLTVGADKQFHTVGAAVAAAHDGNVILVDAGTYTNDFATVRAKLTIIGVGGMVNLVATIPPPDQKAIMTVDNDLTLQNFSFSGSAVSQQSGANGAGIRYEAGHMVLFNDAFIGNQNGVMGGAGAPGFEHQIDIDHCLFSGNGGGTGNTHNLYIGGIDQLNVTNSIFEKANVGHELKSRALATTLDCNWFRNGPTGTASYEIDLPNGGTNVVTNNVIEKGPKAQNTSMVHFGGEGLPYTDSSLLLSGNTFVNDSSPRTIAVLNHAGIPVTISGNTFQNLSNANLLQGPGALSGNVTASGAVIPDTASTSVLPTNSKVFLDNLDHTVSLTYGLKGVQGGAGHLTVNAVAGQCVVVGGSGGLDYTEDAASAANKITTKAGSTNTVRATSGGAIIDSRGTDAITTGRFDTTGQVVGTATIDTGSAYDRWAVLGNATIMGHGGGPFVTVAATGRAALTGVFGSTHLQVSGGSASVDYTQASGMTGAGNHFGLSIAGGSVSLAGYDGHATVTTAAGPQGTVLRLGDGNIAVNSAGKDVIWAGSGDQSVVLSGQGEVHAGTGNLAVFGRGVSAAGAKVFANGGSMTLGGDTGNITYYGGDTDNRVTVNLSNCSFVGGAGRMTVVGGGEKLVQGGSGGLDFDAKGGYAAVVTQAASTNTIRLGIGTLDSWGTDTIIGSANVTVHGDSSITSGTGGGKFVLMGHDTMLGNGNDSVTVTAGADVTFSTTKTAMVAESGATLRFSQTGGKPGSAVLTGGSGRVNADASRDMIITTDAKFATDVVLVEGAATVNANGADTIHGGAGAATIGITAANTEIWGGAGAMTIRNNDFTRGDAQTIHGGSGSMSVLDAAGSLTFIGGSGDAVVRGGMFLNATGGSGNLTATAGSQGMTFLAGAGNATLTGTAGGGEVSFGRGNTTVSLLGWGAATQFDFLSGQGGGNDVIKNFRVGVDRLVLQGVGVQSQSISAGSANLVLTDNTHLQLVGVTNTARLFA